MFNGYAIVLAWPETLCKRAGSWYDFPMHYLSVSSMGYYKVGHSALVLVDEKTLSCNYFDFGRYHSPHGYGRARSAETDHDLIVKKRAVLSANSEGITNIDEILEELFHNPSTHGTGTIYGAVTRINFENALNYTKQIQEKEFIRYGPFIPKGTNCSRFVSSVVQAGDPAIFQKLKLKFPLTISPTPMWNLRATGSTINCFGQPKIKAEQIKVSYKSETMSPA